MHALVVTQRHLRVMRVFNCIGVRFGAKGGTDIAAATVCSVAIVTACSSLNGVARAQRCETRPLWAEEERTYYHKVLEKRQVSSL